MFAELSVKQRYAAAAKAPEAALCCPVDYDRRYLEIIPAEVIEKDYGCGDPSRYVKPGEMVLDLGSGTGKICFTALAAESRTLERLHQRRAHRGGFFAGVRPRRLLRKPEPQARRRTAAFVAL